MTAIVDVAIGVGVVLVVVGAMIWLAKRGYFEPDRADEDPEDREEQAESIDSTDFDVPLRKRMGAWSGPYKLFVVSLVGVALLAVYGVVDVMQTGAGAGKYLGREVQFALVGLVGIAGGIKLTSWFSRQVGTLTVVYERAGDEDLVEQIPYARTAISRRNGRLKLPEVAENRLLGLFWRFRQVGEDRRLRGESKPLDDTILHLLPDHAKEFPDGTGYLVRTKEEGDVVLDSANSAADVAYSSPKSLSDERAVELREQRRRKEAELSAVQATNAQLENELRTLEKKINNWEYKDREELMEDFSEFTDIVTEHSKSIKQRSQSNGAAAALENGDDSEGANA